MNKFMKKGFIRAKKTMLKNFGGPFGACIEKEGKVISIGSNQVLKNNDPTAHAEIIAIRRACKKLKTYDLSGCTLYATGYPCPMCLSAIIWANIKNVYYATDLKDAEKIGFRDDFIYNFIKEQNKNILKIEQLDRDKCIELFNEYSELNKTIY